MISLKPHHTTKPTTTPQLHVVTSVISCALGVVRDYNDNDSKQTAVAGPTASTITPTHMRLENSQKTSPQVPLLRFKWQRVKAGEPVECRKHGLHTGWRIVNLAKNRIKCRMCLRDRENSFSRKAYRAKARALKTLSNKDFNLSGIMLCDLLIKQECRCALSGHVFKSAREVSIDRIDSAKGYTADNVQLVTKPINIAKHTQSDQDFIRMCKQVAEYNK